MYKTVLFIIGFILNINVSVGISYAQTSNATPNNANSPSASPSVSPAISPAGTPFATPPVANITESPVNRVIPTPVPAASNQPVQPPVQQENNGQETVITPPKTDMQEGSLSIEKNSIPQPVAARTYPDSTDARPEPTQTVPQRIESAVLKKLNDTTSSIINPPLSIFAPSKQNYYSDERLSFRDTSMLLIIGTLLILGGYTLYKESKNKAYSRKVKERIFYDWA